MRGREYNRVPLDEDDEDDGDDLIRRQVRHARNQLDEQDRSLEVLSHGVSRLGEMSLEISQEIDTQNKMIDDLDKDMDNAVGTLDMVTTRTKELIKKSGGVKWFAVIVFLVLVLFILTLLVIYS